jgi:hypothetical protein
MADTQAIHKIGKQIIREDDLKISIEYNGEMFTMKYPNPFQRTMIESEIARRLNGMNREVFPVEYTTLVVASTYVDNLIVSEESPKWFTSAWTCYDEELIGALYAGYLRFRDRFQQKIRESGFEGSGEGSVT